MIVDKFIKTSAAKLKSAGIGTARLDALVLLEDATRKDRAWLLAHPEHIVRGPSSHKLAEQITRRANHEPLAYIRGKTEFYGRDFIITKDVLEPRPESETMIDLLKKIAKPSQVIVDVGTGSGALAITAQLEMPNSTVYGTDIDAKCLEVARKNAKKYNAPIKFFEGNLIEPLPSSAKPQILLCNLPYVPNSYTLNDAAKNEPKTAIFGGNDGLNIYRKLFTLLKIGKFKPRYILSESLPFQQKELAKIAQKAGFKLQKTDDFIQLFESA